MPQTQIATPASACPGFLRNIFGTRDHAVWPVPNVPSTLYWEEADFVRHEDMNRPRDYTGGRHDQEAWAAYEAVKEAEAVAAALARFRA